MNLIHVNFDDINGYFCIDLHVIKQHRISFKILYVSNELHLSKTYLAVNSYVFNKKASMICSCIFITLKSAKWSVKGSWIFWCFLRHHGILTYILRMFLCLNIHDALSGILCQYQSWFKELHHSFSLSELSTF